MRILIALFSLIYAMHGAATDLRVEEVEFTSHEVTLSGSIVRPTDRAVHAAVVFIHGSGKQTRSLYWAERFAREGIVALVYDKRGVGKSGGEYEDKQNVSEHNISLLADDAIAGLNELYAHPSLKGVPVGFAGISQAGWIAPLAAEKSGRAKFLLLWSGPVCKVSEEDIFSKYTADEDAQTAPTYEEALKARRQPYVWPDSLGRDTDPSQSLRRLSIPGLWIFADNDTSIPVDLSLTRLQSLRAQGHRYDYVLFSGLGHNNMEATFLVGIDWIKRSVVGEQRAVPSSSGR